MATKEAKRRASAKYDKTHTKGIYLKLNLERDKDIIEFLDGVENVQGYIKKLIRWQIEEFNKLPPTLQKDIKL